MNIMMKKKIAGLLVFAMLLAMLPITAAADWDDTRINSVTVTANGKTYENRNSENSSPSSTEQNPYEIHCDAVQVGIDGELTIDLGVSYSGATVEKGAGTTGELKKSGTTSLKWTYRETLDSIPLEATPKTLRFNVKDGENVAYYKITFTISSAVQSLSVDKDSLTLGVGGLGRLYVSGAAPDGVTWTSSDPAVATVDERGRVTAVKLGKATIKASLKKNNAISGTCEVNVIDRKVKSLTLDKAAMQLVLNSRDYDAVGHSWPTIIYDDGTEVDSITGRAFEQVTWTSSNTDVATVEEGDGFVKAVGVGRAVITATSKEDPTKSAACTVAVGDFVVGDSVTSAAIDQAALDKADEAVKTAMTEAKTELEEKSSIYPVIVSNKASDGAIIIDGKTVVSGDALQAKLAEAGEGAKTVVVPILEAKVIGGKSEDGDVVSLSYDLSMSAQAGIQKGYEKPELIGEKVPIENPGPVKISLGLPFDFYNRLMGRQGVVKHTKGSKVFWHYFRGPDGYAEFTNPHGFSNFTCEAAGEVELNGAYYSMEDALKNAKDGDTINVLQYSLTASDVNKNINFKLAGGVDDLTVTAANGYKVSRANDADGVDTITVTDGSSPSNPDKPSGSSSSGGGGSSKPSIRPGAGTDKAPATPAAPTVPTTPTAPGGGVAGFSDVAASSWYADSVQYVVNKGLFGGVGNGSFAPNANMTRAMMWTVLARYKGVNTNTGSNWYDAAKAWAIAQGISDGTAADGSVTREQFVTMLWRLSGEPAVTNSASFTDGGNVAAYAKTAVDWAVSQGIVNGYSDGTFKPQGSATRAEVAKMLTVFCTSAEG